MRAALLREYHRPLELVERPEPEPTSARSVVVRIGGAGVCATDLHAIDGLMEPAGLTTPVVLGHENAGWVHGVGDDVTTTAVGDAVLLYPAWSCGLCVPCRRGQDVFCVHHQFTGLTRDGGGLDTVRQPDERALVGNLVGNWIDLWELLQLHARGEVTLRSETHPLEEVNEVLDKLREGEVTGRAVLVP